MFNVYLSFSIILLLSAKVKYMSKSRGFSCMKPNGFEYTLGGSSFLPYPTLGNH